MCLQFCNQSCLRLPFELFVQCPLPYTHTHTHTHTHTALPSFSKLMLFILQVQGAGYGQNNSIGFGAALELLPDLAVPDSPRESSLF